MSFQCDCADEHAGGDFSLFTQIDSPNVRSLNIVPLQGGEPSMVFKPWEHRFDETALESDADDQIILFVPFTSSVRLKSIALLGPPDNHAPAHLKVFVNRTDIDFDSVESAVPTQEWELVACPPRGVVPEYPTRLPLFTSVRNLTIFISSSVGAETTKVSFIGLKGDYTPVNRNPIITNYEIAANPADHKTKASTGGLSNMIL